ncbi:MAG: YigZ family protein [Clostridium sp.]|nr:YigZ family protein [Clostridium sp.]
MKKREEQRKRREEDGDFSRAPSAQPLSGEPPYRILKKGGEGEITEKKSRFLAAVRRVETQEEAAAFLEERKKKYWDAAHHTFAVVIGSRAQIQRYSDDGEPGGTAGRPMLEVLLGEGLRDAAVVVTRYFGGTLLGTGGLARAYARAVKEGLKHCETGTVYFGQEILIRTDYNGIGNILYRLKQRGIEPTDSRYTDAVELTLRTAARESEELRKELTQAAAGQLAWEVQKTGYFEM